MALEQNRSSELLCLDFSKFLQGSDAEKESFCKDFAYALSNAGFVKLFNHGISSDQVTAVFDMNARFFSLPQCAKSRAAHAKQPNPHRGYSYVGQEKLSRVRDFEKGHLEDEEVLDVKESFDQGPADDELYPNRWPDDADLPGFQHFMEQFYETCHEAHMHILRAIEMSLALPPTCLQKLCCDNTSELRLNHYPPIDVNAVKKGAMRISEHTDFGTVTLLFQDSIGGLEVEDQTQRGRYLSVACGGSSEMIVNIGDCLQRWTNNKLHSTSHRVTLPPGIQSAGDRYSIAYFGKPNREQSVGTLPEFVVEGSGKLYEGITAWEYNQQKLLRTY